MVGERQGNGRRTAWEQHWNGMVCVNPPLLFIDANALNGTAVLRIVKTRIN
jgi:hypothetical protein